MITYQVDQASLQRVQRKLGTMQSKAPIVISRALNKTAVSARQRLATRAQAAYTVKSGGFKKDMQIKKASSGNLVAEIRSRDARSRSRSLNILRRSPEQRQTSQRAA